MTTFYLFEAVHLAQTTLAAWGLYHSAIAIKNLREYESASEKAAKFSAEAGRQLHLTRTTQTAGAVGLLASLAVSLVLATSWHHLPSAAQTLASPVLLVGTLFCRGHMDNFWKARSKVPMVKGYNEAVDETRLTIEALRYLEYSWVLTSFMAGVLGYH